MRGFVLTNQQSKDALSHVLSHTHMHKIAGQNEIKYGTPNPDIRNMECSENQLILNFKFKVWIDKKLFLYFATPSLCPPELHSGFLE